MDGKQEELGFVVRKFPFTIKPYTEATPRELGHQAAAQAADHADARNPGWQDGAYALFCAHAKAHPEGFTTEDVRKANPLYPEPPDNRSWGAPARRALLEGLIRSDGFADAKDRKVHGRAVTRWIPV